jgi:N-methylhydantoinase A
MPVEIVTFRVDARGALPASTMRELPPAGPLEAARTAVQTVFFEDGPAEVPIYARERLGAGARILGPAILTQFDATTLVLPGQRAEVDRLGSLLISEAGSP